jgi:disulfide oxidoreductase YuzD
MDKEYKYNLRSRPFGIGTYPQNENFVRFEEDGSRFGCLVYSKPLSIELMENYELVPITDILEYDGRIMLWNDKYDAEISVLKNDNGIYYIKVLITNNDKEGKPITMSALDFLKEVESGKYKNTFKMTEEGKKKRIDELMQAHPKLVDAKFSNPEGKLKEGVDYTIEEIDPFPDEQKNEDIDTELYSIHPIAEVETPILEYPKQLYDEYLPTLDIISSKEASDALESEIGGDKGKIDKHIRYIPIQEYDTVSNNRSYKLAEKIQENGYIEPLIVSFDAKGVYIVEGQHRADALKQLGYKKAPVIVIYDKTKKNINNNIYYTNAPEAYDGFGTKTIEITEYLDHRSKPVRKITIPESALEWQKNRNASGNNSTLTEAEFEQYKDTIFNKKPMATELKTETKIVESISQTEKNKSPLTEISIQNAEIKDNSYQPQSDSCATVDTVVPASMRYDMHKAIETVDRRVNGVDEYVAEKLGYILGNCTLEQRKEGLKCLCDAFSAEQVDAIAVAIYNIEEKKQGCIIGDQTGIGKGRIAAGMIRYAMLQGHTPIFLTEKPNLFSDLFRDIINIGSDSAIPLQILAGTKLVEKKSVKKDPEESDEDTDKVEEGFEEEEPDFVEVEQYTKNKGYPDTYTFTQLNENGIEETITRKRKVSAVPFIINGGGSKTYIKDEQGNILYKGSNTEVASIVGKTVKTSEIESYDENGKAKYKRVFEAGTMKVPSKYNFILATYSQFNKGENTPKSNLLLELAKGNIVVMDESHNASGDSNIGIFLAKVLAVTKGVTFLSATFAKRPDNMPIYAGKTCLSDANMTDEQLVAAIVKGGVALQEIVSSNLVAEGQMIRRERSFEGIEVNYKYLDSSQTEAGLPNLDLEQKHRAIMDRATDIIRSIMEFQTVHVNPLIERLDREQKAEYRQAKGRKGTTKAGVDNPPVFSGIFNVINQLLFSIKAEAVGQVAIQRLKEGKKPVIAFASTMESFLNTLTNDDGTPVGDGDIINSDFSKIFEKRLKSVLKYTVTDAEGNSEPEYIDVLEQDLEFQLAYRSILSKIQESSIGISSSPIDVVVDVIQKAGYSTVEVTGRKRQLKLLGKDTAMIKNRVVTTANDAFRKFNNNQVDCLLINQSGSTGASAHAIPTKNVPADKVKQRVMIILQAELNINTEVQKRGRINRTGQILKPIYDYVVSAIPAEKRLMVMLQKKLKSLDANTTAKQDQSEELMDIKQVDFLNKYGDQVAVEYLKENPLVNKMIDDPLKLESDEKEKGEASDVSHPEAAHKVSGRIAILSVKDQEIFYNEISNRYVSLIQFLNDTGENDLKVKDLELNAETLEKEIVVVGREGASVFARNSILEKIRVDNLKKPYKKSEIELILKETLGDATAQSLRDNIITKYKIFADNVLQQNLVDIESHYEDLMANVSKEKAILKIEDDYERSQAIQMRKSNLSQTKIDAIQRERSIAINKSRIVTTLFEDFLVGSIYAYPSATYSYDRAYYLAVFLGFNISETAKNPYAPSALKLRFAVGGSISYVAVPASKFDITDAILAVSRQLTYSDRNSALENWDDLMREKSAERVNRYVVTGNILQAYGNAELRGALVSYTTSTGGVKKGILLPESWTKDRQQGKDQLRISVPILYALSIIKSMVDGRTIRTTDNFAIQRQGYNYKLIVPANRKLYGKYFADEAGITLRKYTADGIFNSQSGNYVAMVDYTKIDDVVKELHTKFGCSVELIQQEFDMIKDKIKVDDYDDEETKPEGDVFIEKLTEVDTQEEARRKTEEEQKAFDDEQKAISDALKKEEEQQAEADAFMLEKRKLAAKKKLVNLLRIFAGKDILMKQGGKVGSENAQMVLNNNVQIMHHAEELKDAVKNSKNIPAWVVAKVYDATETLSDVTHYLEGENKMAKGGYLIDIINTDGVPNILAEGGGVNNDVWEKYQIQDKHGYVSYFDDKDMALKFLKENEDSFAIRWDDTEQLTMATGGGIKSAFKSAVASTKKAIHDKQKNIAIKVIDNTKDKVSKPKEKMILKAAENIVDTKYATGGNLESLEQQAYDLGRIACKNDKPRTPAQNKELMHFAKQHDVFSIKGGFLAIMKSFEKGYYDENDIAVRKQFPDFYKNR